MKRFMFDSLPREAQLVIMRMDMDEIEKVVAHNEIGMLEITMTVNGVDVNFLEIVSSFFDSFEEFAEERAREIILEKTDAIGDITVGFSQQMEELMMQYRKRVKEVLR